MRREKNEKKFAIAILILGAVCAAPFFTGKIILNTTPSVPIGLWLKDDSEINRGDFVQVPFEAFKFNSWVPEIYKKKNSWGNIPYLKRIAGLPGDEVEILPDGLLKVAGKIIPGSSALSSDSLGNKLETYPLPITLESNEVWLISDSERGFDSRYLGPAVLSQCHKVLPLITN